jgi:hypothetical protein
MIPTAADPLTPGKATPGEKGFMQASNEQLGTAKAKRRLPPLP